MNFHFHFVLLVDSTSGPDYILANCNYRQCPLILGRQGKNGKDRGMNYADWYVVIRLLYLVLFAVTNPDFPPIHSSYH